MKISTLTNWAYGITVALTGVSGLAFILSIQMAHQERLAVETHLALADLTSKLEINAEFRTGEARLYVMRGDHSHRSAFENVNTEEHQLQGSALRIKEFGGTERELQRLMDISETADQLEEIEVRAVELFESGAQDQAQALLFGDRHYALHLHLMEEIKEFQAEVSTRTGLDLQSARLRSELFGVIARIMLGLTAIVFLAVLYFVLKRRVALPLSRMSGIVRKLARQDYAVEVPSDNRQDEIGELTAAISVFRENGLERERLDAERKRDLRMKDTILQMMRRMQACDAVPEIADVVAKFGPQIFSDLGGALYILNDTKSVLHCAASWPLTEEYSSRIDPGECWSLRRGQIHFSDEGRGDVLCKHLPGRAGPGVCLPLQAHGEAFGILVFKDLSGQPALEDTYTAYLCIIAENVGLALANLHLRDRLTKLAVCDPLTSLLNRRSLDEALATYDRENTGRALSCLMIDIDYFKRFNDEFGHDAGDTVLSTFSDILTEIVGERGKCFRFGGEEFSVLLPDVSAADAFQIAEHIRTKTGTTSLSHSGHLLGTITVSIGIADTHSGDPITSILARADKALMLAKKNGRNRTIAGTPA